MRWARVVASTVLGMGSVAFVPAHDDVAPQPLPRLRVMTWNVLGSADPDPGALAAEIARRGVAVAGLQEIEEAQAFEVEEHLRKTDPRWRAVWHPTGHDPGGRLPFTPPMEGHAILSRLPMTRAASWRLPQRDFHERIVQRVVVTIGDDGLFVYNTHLCRTPELTFVDRACWALDQAGRTAQARAVLRRIRHDGGRSLLFGDLNARPGAPPIELLDGYMRDAGGGRRSETRIDYVFVRGLVVERVSTPHSRLSDHDPGVAELSLSGP